eukprot:1005771-Alexandrium_andersonii.AAC.1
MLALETRAGRHCVRSMTLYRCPGPTVRRSHTRALLTAAIAICRHIRAERRCVRSMTLYRCPGPTVRRSHSARTMTLYWCPGPTVRHCHNRAFLTAAVAICRHSRAERRCGRSMTLYRCP